MQYTQSLVILSGSSPPPSQSNFIIGFLGGGAKTPCLLVYKFGRRLNPKLGLTSKSMNIIEKNGGRNQKKSLADLAESEGKKPGGILFCQFCQTQFHTPPPEQVIHGYCPLR